MDGELPANVSCAREIEEAIRTYGDGESGALCREAAQSILDRWGFKRTTFVLANTLREEGSYGRFLSEENRQWQKEQYLPSDHENRYFTVDTAGVFLDAFIGQVREAYKALNLLGRNTVSRTPFPVWTMRARNWSSPPMS